MKSILVTLLLGLLLASIADIMLSPMYVQCSLIDEEMLCELSVKLCPDACSCGKG